MFLFSWMAAPAADAPYNWGRKIKTDPDGNVIVAMNSDDGTHIRNKILIIKYSGAGVALWTNRYGELDNRGNSVGALAVDNKGNVLVAADNSHDPGDGGVFKRRGGAVDQSLQWPDRQLGRTQGLGGGG